MHSALGGGNEHQQSVAMETKVDGGARACCSVDTIKHHWSLVCFINEKAYNNNIK